MSYRSKSDWNELNELQCLLIFKKLEADDFPRLKQMEYSRELEKVIGINHKHISAKVTGYKAVAKVINDSHKSANTIRIYNQYKGTSIKELKGIIEIISRTL